MSLPTSSKYCLFSAFGFVSEDVTFWPALTDLNSSLQNSSDKSTIINYLRSKKKAFILRLLDSLDTKLTYF